MIIRLLVSLYWEYKVEMSFKLGENCGGKKRVGNI